MKGVLSRAAHAGAAALALAACGVAGAATAQASGAAQEWHAFSRSGTTVYLADVNSIAQSGDVTSIMVSRVRITPPSPTDRSYSADRFELRCSARRIRSVLEIIYGENGEEEDRFEDAAVEWDPITDNSFGGYLRAVVCDGSRASPPHYSSIAAFIDAGRR